MITRRHKKVNLGTFKLLTHEIGQINEAHQPILLI